MKENKNISIEEAAKKGLNSFEVPFIETDWEQMEALLNKPNKHWLVLLFLPLINRLNLKKTLIMTTLFCTLAAGIFYLTSVVSGTTSSTSQLAMKNQSGSSAIKIPENLKSAIKDNATFLAGSSKQPFEDEKKHKAATSGTTYNNVESAQISPKVENQIAVVEVNKLLEASPILPSITPMDSSKRNTVSNRVKKTLIHEVWVEPEYEYIRIKHEGDMEDFWMGIHYTQEAIDYTDSNKTHGFNLQFMSGNLIKNTPFAFYGGLDWGMQFSGKSDRQEVILNTTNEDIGYTYLSSLSNDILLRGHFEFPKYKIVPYATFFAGPRLYSTGQTVGMHNPPIEVEATSRENVRNAALLAMGGGIGARIKLTDYASLDMRYEQIFGETKSVVDLEASRLSGTAYNLRYKNQATDFGQFKLGVIFDLSSSDYEKKITKEGYYKEVTETYYIDPEDADKIIIPSKPCPQNTTMDNRRYEGQDENTNWFPNNGSRSSGSGNSGGGKSSTPSIKAPVIRH